MNKNWIDPYRNNFQSDRYETRRGDVRLGDGKGKTVAGAKGPIYPEKINIVTDEKYYEELYNLYANVLNAKGYNIKDTFSAAMCYFNKAQNRIADPVTNGKTYIFITRPDLNFWQKGPGVRNVNKVGLFNYMARMQIGRLVMPWLMYPNGLPLEFGKENGAYIANRTNVGGFPIWVGQEPYKGIRSNAFTPFIPILSNTCTSCTGAKDLSLETKTTEGDYHGNKLQYAKAGDETFEPGELSLEFDDIYGSPVLHLINLWVNYIHYLSKGICTIWGKYAQYRIIDYTCSIYIFMTDKDNTTITRWAKWTGCFPKSVPLSNIQHNMSIQADALRSISVPFAYNRYEPMNPDTLVDFNTIMNKIIFGASAYWESSYHFGDNQLETNMKWLQSMGVSPEELIKSTDDTATFLGSHDEWYAPKYVSSPGDIRVKGKVQYDNQFWGTVPYVKNHQLVWIDPRGIDISTLQSKRSSLVGKFNNLFIPQNSYLTEMQNIINAKDAKYSF